jgi:N-acetylglucosamine-6-phosphate deacetylase
MKCCEHFIRHGQTTILPTFYCNLTLERMIEGAEKIRKLSKEGIGRVMDGLYMEGPYMNGGGSNQKYILWTDDITKEEYIPLVAALKDIVRVWAIDPARKNIEEFMAYVHAETPDAIFALGHSHATAAQCRRVQKYGVKVQTHFGCSGKAKGLAQGCIGPGCDEYDLSNPDIYAEVIPDEVGVHLQSDMLRYAVRTKGVERVIVITDSMASKEKFLNNEEEGIAYGPDLNYDYEGHLAGSRLTEDNAVRNIMAHTGYGICHAIRFATYNPACMLGIDDKVGSLEAGKKANIIIIDDTVRVKKVFLEGELAVDNGEIVMG